jgi:DNA-binding PadR family transcriptional regulator
MIRRRTKIGGQFSWRLIEMMESPAYQALSLSAHRVLDRLEIELAHHGGTDNGRLAVTYADFRKYGIDHQAIAPAIRELVALGFVEVTERGRAGNAEYRTPNRYRLTCRDAGRVQPTNDWRKIKTNEDAQVTARAARKTSEKQMSGVEKPFVSVGETHTDSQDSPVGETHTTVLGRETHTTSIFRGGGRDAA